MHLGYKGYRDHRSGGQIWRQFSLAEFFEAYESRFRSKPRYTDRTAPPPGYAKDWSQISTRYRASVGWRCEHCGIDLNDHKDLLHTHHLNGVTGDNTYTNLRALCVVCHSEQPAHSMRVPAEQRAVIERLRRNCR